MILIRIILIILIFYLFARYLIQAFENKEPEKFIDRPEEKDEIKNKKVSKKIGEYVDYEEIEE